MEITKNNPSVTTFRINDDGRQHEFSSSKRTLNEYVIAVAEFIKTLGFEVTVTEKGFDKAITINGEAFTVHTDFCSYMAKSAYGNEIKVRNPENRFVGLQILYDAAIIRIPINKEINAAKLVKKIKSEIDALNKIRKENKLKNALRRQNTEAVARFFLAHNLCIQENVRRIITHKGTVRLVADFGTIIIKTTGEIVQVNFYLPAAQNTEELKRAIRISEDICFAEHILEEAQRHVLPPALQEWAADAWEATFNVVKNCVE